MSRSLGLTLGSILLPVLFFHLTLQGQETVWRGAYNGFFDNREYFNNYVQPQTMGGSRASAEVGYALNKNEEFLAGADFLYEFGSRPNLANTKPVIYFHYKNNFVSTYLGSFPRYRLVNLPYVLLADTFQYYRPNVEGIYVKFRKPWGSQSAWLDWTSRQTNTDRETFLIGGTGVLHSQMLFFRYDFIMMHFAGPAIRIPNDHIRDNGGLVAVAGMNLSHKTFLDSLEVSSGIAFSYDRLRNVYNFRFPIGSFSEINLLYKFVGIKSTFYFGQGQIQMVGDGLYQASFYNRTDMYLKFFKRGRVNGKVQFSLHFIEHVLDVSQSFTIYADLSGRKPVHSSIDNVDNWSPHY